MTDLPDSPAPLDSASTSDALRYACLLIITAGCALSAASIYRAKPLLSANDRSRWATIRALVDDGTFIIDDVIRDRGWDTIDKVRYEDHFYSTKPPLLPILVAGLVWCIQQTTGMTLAKHTADMTHIVLTAVNLLPWIAFLVLLWRILERYARTQWSVLLILATASFGTFLTPFTVTLNNHTVAACSVMFALYPTLRIAVDGERRAIYFAAAGFFAAFACCNELPAAAFGALLFLYLVSRAPKQTLLFFVPAALVPLVAFFATNILVTGGIKPFYAYYGKNPGPYYWEFEGKKSYWLDPKGLDRGGDSPFVYFLHCTIGHHGIFSLSPIFLLTLAAWFTRKYWPQNPLRDVVVASGLLTAIVLVFYLTRTGSYNYGGNTAGLRWTFWLIPFWLIAMIPVVDAWGSHKRFRIVAVALLAISIFSATYALENPWQPPWLYAVMQRQGWIDYGR